jgi:Flp pilus assembly secretin CpaC
MFFGGIPALAQEETLLVGEVRVIDTDFEIRSILNGSGEVVNLNVEGTKTLIMTGIMPGRSNVIVLGTKDERLKFSLVITTDQRDLIHVHRGPDDSAALRCNPRCDTSQTKDQAAGASNPNVK